MSGIISLEELKKRAASGEIDTVISALVDMQGRLMGKRFHVSNFIESAYKETHACVYLLATDYEMGTPEGFASASWSSGYGDYAMLPDMSTLRVLPWLPKTALVFCDVEDHHHHKMVTHSPRQILRRQIERAEALGLKAMMASELEFFLFKESFEELRQNKFAQMTPFNSQISDYNIFQTTRVEGVMRRLRNELHDAGVPIECSKGEAELGQQEINAKYADALTNADYHCLIKQATKDIAWQEGHAITFMAKYHHNKVGSSSHVHQSLWTLDGKSAFRDDNDPTGMSKLMQQYLAGMMKYAAEYTYFLAPNINSYKRFAAGTFAPTKLIWSSDNRTAGFRICGQHSDGIRIECRVGGSDLNPYLAFAAQMAAGLAGIEEGLSLETETIGNAYVDTALRDIPKSLRKAREYLKESQMLRSAFGDDVVEHYARAAEVELEKFDVVVTDWEVNHGFEGS